MNGVQAAFRYYGLEKVADEGDIYDKPSGWKYALPPVAATLGGAALSMAPVSGTLQGLGSLASSAGMLSMAPLAALFSHRRGNYAAEQAIKRPTPASDDERQQLRELLDQANPDTMRKLHARFQHHKP